MKIHIIILTFFLILISCGNEPPVINLPCYNILIYQKESLNMSNDSIFLSVYFTLEDENGFNDIQQIKIIHLKTDFTWNIPLEILKTPVIFNERSYYGYPFLEYEDGKSILCGDYLIEITDSAGNTVQAPIYVESIEKNSDEPLKIPEIKYTISKISNKEIKISGDDYNSCEIRFLNDTVFFNGGRKKFQKGDKIILNNEPMPSNTQISVRINKDPNNNIVYFLKTFILM